MKLSRLRVEPHYYRILPLVLLGGPGGWGLREVLSGGNLLWWIPIILFIGTTVFFLSQMLLWGRHFEEDEKGN